MKSRLALLLAAIIWGFGFVAQRQGMEYIAPFPFNAARFALGGLALLPVVVALRGSALALGRGAARRTLGLGGATTGVVLFVAASLQQIGIVHTTAGKAGFITGLYVIIVPILGLLLGQRTGLVTWAGAVSAVIGLYLLTVTETLSVAPGDLIVLVGAFFWAVHLLLVDKFSSRIGALRLALIQFAVCAALSWVAAMLYETIQSEAIVRAASPILYTGVLSVSIAYTFQVVGQRATPPTPSAIILSLETVFAVLGGWLVLGETLSPRGILGCVLMFVGMILSQFDRARQPAALARAESVSE